MLRFPCAALRASARAHPGAWLVPMALVLCPPGITAGELIVEVKAHRVTVQANQADPMEILRELGQHLDLAVTAPAAIGQPVTLSFSQLPLATALRTVLRDRGFILRMNARGQPAQLLVLGAAQRQVAAVSAPPGQRPPTAEPALLHRQLMADADPGVRANAVHELAELGDLDGLELALTDADPGVREAAVEGLADIDDARARTALQIAAEDIDSRVSDEARDALAEWTERPRATAPAPRAPRR